MIKIKIFYDKEKSMVLMKRIEEKFGEQSRKKPRGSEMHVSDLTGCPLKPYCRLIGLKQIFSKSSIGIMVFGIVSENMIGWTFPNEQLQYQSSIPFVEGDENIFGHIDIYEDFKFPLEVKSSRKTVYKASQLPRIWVEQLMSYMAMQGETLGWIVLFNVFAATIMAFQLQMSNSDIMGWLITLTERSGRIKLAFKKRNPMWLEPSGEEYFYCAYKKECPRRVACRDKWKEIEAEKKRLKKLKKQKKK